MMMNLTKMSSGIYERLYCYLETKSLGQLHVKHHRIKMSKTTKHAIFTQGQLESIAQVLGDTNTGLTGTEIAHTLQKARMKDVDPNNTKWRRIYNAFITRQNSTQTGNCVINFIHYALEPARYIGKGEIFELRREGVNLVLAFRGLQFLPTGKFGIITQAQTLREAERRAKYLRNKLSEREVHPDVLDFCRAELLEDNYFHAVLEAVKSIDSKLRQRSGIDADGSELYDTVLGGNQPQLRINEFRTKSHRSEQRGFVNLLKGLYGTFRNPTAHEARVEWYMGEADALDLLSIVSYAHRRIDKST
jgi:uncharacterized protein (TIGR02391 family)